MPREELDDCDWVRGDKCLTVADEIMADLFEDDRLTIHDVKGVLQVLSVISESIDSFGKRLESLAQAKREADAMLPVCETPRKVRTLDRLPEKP